MDLGWVVVELASVGFAFDAVVVRAVSLDHSRVGAVPSFGIGSLDDFVDGFGDCGGESVRGKNPPGWEPGGGSRGSCV